MLYVCMYNTILCHTCACISIECAVSVYQCACTMYIILCVCVYVFMLVCCIVYSRWLDAGCWVLSEHVGLLVLLELNVMFV